MSDLSNLSAQSGIPVDFQSGDDLDGFLEKNISAIESLDDRALASVEILNQLLQSPLKSKVLDFGSIQRLIELSLKLEPKDIKRSSLIVNILFSVLNKHSSDEQILQLFQSRIQIPSSGNPTTLLHRLLKLTSTIKAHSQKNTELALRFLGLVSHLGKQENATPADRVTMAKKFPAVLDLFCTVISKMSPAERTKMKSLINEIFYNLKAYPLRQNEEGCCDHAAMAKLYQSGLLDFFLKDCGRPGMTDFGFGLVNISAFGCEAFRVIQNSGIFKNLFKLLRNPEVTPKTKLEIAALISKVTARMFHSPMFFRASKVLNPAENRLILQVLIEDRTEELSELQSNIFHYFFNIFNGNPRGVSDFCSEDLLVAAKRELEKVLGALEKGKTKSTGSILTDITQFLAVASMTFLRGPKSPVTPSPLLEKLKMRTSRRSSRLRRESLSSRWFTSEKTLSYSALNGNIISTRIYSLEFLRGICGDFQLQNTDPFRTWNTPQTHADSATKTEQPRDAGDVEESFTVTKIAKPHIGSKNTSSLATLNDAQNSRIASK
eukprot:TRINITY_DN3162_c0_g1_i4.p1 TRINITY_DN3162_c0_g1~~TRINITY_DN3162_c0_g1_i4.p1  ORF type:complete len:548 (-),score=102.13 TRINITY_DN3162_c0_g1_i4:31-1674(-)